MHVILPCGRVRGVAYCGVLGASWQGSWGGLLRGIRCLEAGFIGRSTKVGCSTTRLGDSGTHNAGQPAWV